MELLLRSPGEALVASCVAAWGFYFLALFLEQPFIFKLVEDWITKQVKLPKPKIDAILSGIHVRSVGAVFNTIQVSLALYALMDPDLWKDTWHAVTPLSQIILVISAGFFWWDIAVSIRRAKTDGTEFIMHGALCFAFYLYTTLSRNYHFYGCGFLLWEMSTPFVHLRWFLYKIGKSGSKLYLYNGILMMLVFCLCRICWGGYLGVKFIVSSLQKQDTVSPIMIWILRTIWVALNCLNWHWFWLMLKGSFRLLVKKPQHFEERVTTQNGSKLKT